MPYGFGPSGWWLAALAAPPGCGPAPPAVIGACAGRRWRGRVALIFSFGGGLWLRLSVRVAGGRVVVSWFVPRRFVGGRFCSVSWRVGRWSWRLWLRWSLPG